MNPGSKDAIKNGCTCPVLDNAHGQGRQYGGLTVFVMQEDCPLHGTHMLAAETQPVVPDEESATTATPEPLL